MRNPHPPAEAPVALRFWWAPKLGIVAAAAIAAALLHSPAATALLLALIALAAAADFALSRRFLARLASDRQGERDLALSASKFAALGEVAAGMAHEINTPLGAIMLCSSQLKALTPDQRADEALVGEIVDDLLASSEKISRIVRGLRTLSRGSGEEGDFLFCDLTTLIQESLALCEATFRAAGVELRVLPLPGKIEIEGNPSQLSQVVVNLINNARDAAAGTPERWVELQATATDAQVELRITDSGTGIPPAVREKLFQPFFTTKEVGKGTGLGLNIVGAIARRHHGEVFVDHAAPHTTFVVRLPRMQKR